MKKTILIIGFCMMTMATFAEATDLWINEFVSDPESGLSSDEWIELYHGGGTDLSSCYIEEGSGAKSYLSENALEYILIENPGGVLNNGADIIRLYCDGMLIDEVSYSDGIPGDGKSFGRNEQNVFVEFDDPTPGAVNFISSSQEPEEQQTPDDVPEEPANEQQDGGEPVPLNDEPEDESDAEPDDVPEFTTIGALLAVAGCGLFITRKRLAF